MGNINFKARLLVPFTLALIVFLGVFVFYTYQHELRDIDEASERLVGSALELFRGQVSSDATALAVSIRFISENKELAALMVKGDRSALFASAKHIYHELSKNQKVTHFYFHNPDMVNFLRMHSPTFYDDTINSYTALKAEKTQNLFYGMELGKFGHLTLRVVSPWIVDGKLIGYLELGEEIGHILKNIKNTLDVDFILTIDKNFLKQSDWEEGMAMLGRKGKWDNLPKSVIADTSLGNNANLLKIVKSGKDKVFSDEKNGIANFFYKDDMNSRYGVDLVRLEDVSGRNVASLYILWNITRVIAGAIYYVLLVGAISLVAGVFLFILFYITLNRVEKELSFFYKSLEAASADNARLAAAVEQADEMVVMTDKDGTIQYVNPAFESVTGYRREEILGKKPDVLSSGKHDETFYRTMWNTIYAGDIWKGRFINKKKDGSLFDSDCVISPVRGQDGAIVNYVSLQRDVTRDRKLESKLRASQKMEAIGTLAGGIAHDFNNILTGIIGYTELANDDLKEGSEAKENLDAALKAGARAKDLVAEILMFSRDGEQAANQVYLQTVVRETLGMLRPIIPSTISIRESIDDSLPSIMANCTQITQVIMNLCTNAEHSMRKNGGVLNITLGGFEADGDFASVHE
ncbi:diguanylate cyclase/phosphodiesterase (GGDEF & EAL domains) with PAS/PAC sensor(s), partial [hydrothermal vent metagenome]